MLVSKLNGLIVPLLTPFNEDLSVDFFALKNSTARLMNKGVKNFLLFDYNSEAVDFSLSTKKKILQTVSKELGCRGKIITCCFSSSADKIIENVLFFERFSDYCAVNVPFDALTNEIAFIDFFDKLFTKTNAQIILYNDPTIFKRNIQVSGIDRIAGWEKLFGFIDNSGNSSYFNALSYYYQNIKLFQGKESFCIESFNHKSSGVVPALANIVPELFLNLKKDFDLFGYNALIRQELQILALFDKFPKNKKIQSYKKVLALLGIIQPFFSKNLEPLNEEEIEIINRLIRKSLANN